MKLMSRIFKMKYKIVKKTIISQKPFLLLFFISLTFLSSCDIYHNTTARYNPYFLAKEEIKRIDKDIFDNRSEDYNNILDVIPMADTTQLKTYEEGLNKAIEECARIVSWHDESNWVDKSYNLVGKARRYLAEYEDAVKTFKYVNTKGNTEDEKHAALIELMLTYIVMEDLDNARTVMNYLKRQSLTPENESKFFVVRAHYYRLGNNYKATAQFLSQALPEIKRGEIKARYFFILGQLFQRENLNPEALKYYRYVKKNNPNYELLFYSQLYAAQVSELNDQSDAKKILRFFKKLLNDEKNTEFRDKIYYERALFKYNQGEIYEAVIDLTASVLTSTENQIQKSYSFLKLAEIYFEDLEDYELSQVYYDSTVLNLPETAENYEEVITRHAILEEFIQQLTSVRLEDSLQKFAKMDSLSLEPYLDEVLTADEKRKQKEQEELKAELAKLNYGLKDNSSSNQALGGWYFSNDQSITIGKRDFNKEWKNRPLEDDWRRRNKNTNPEPDSVYQASLGTNPIDEEELLKRRVEARKNELYDIIPFEDSAFAASEQKLAGSLYHLGKIYNFQLKDTESADKTFRRLMRKFPDNPQADEVLYTLYTIARTLDDADSTQFKNEVLNRFPNSTYARLIENPNYLAESNSNKQEVDSSYAEIYELFQNEEYAQAQAQIQALNAKYPNSYLRDKLDYLDTVIAAATLPKNQYLPRIEAFIQKYPDSPLKARAEKLLETAKDL